MPSHNLQPRSSRSLEVDRDDRRALCERLAGCLADDGEPGAFLLRRTRALVAALPRDERLVLLRALDSRGEPQACARALLAWAGQLEGRGRFEEAEFAADLAARRCPHDPTLDLHRARIARKAGHAEKALLHYLQTLDRVEDRDPALARMARLGCVLVGPAGEYGISEILRESVRSGDAESAAVAQEARARRRIGAGDRAGAIRDLICAAARYPQPVDRGRVGLELADLLLARGDGVAARLVLEQLIEAGLPAQAAAARSRLWQLARQGRDQVGMRRWGDAGGPSDLVGLLPPLRTAARAPTAAPLISTALRRITALAGTRTAVGCPG